MNTSQSLTDTDTRRPVVIWALLIFLALRIAVDARALVAMHAVIDGEPTASRVYNLYLAAASLALFRLGAVSLAIVLLWRGSRVGLVIAAMLFLAELYSEVLMDMTGGVVESVFGPPTTEGDAVARAGGRYTMLIAPLALLAWCSFSSSCRRYFHRAP